MEVALENRRQHYQYPKNITHGGFSWVLPTPRDDYEFMIANPLTMKDLGLSLDEMEDPVFN